MINYSIKTVIFPELLKNHILPNVICSSAIQGKSKSKSLMNKFVNLTKEADDKIFVNGAQAVETDVMATNGVLYVIDDVLVPDEGKLCQSHVRNILRYS